jgi:hypothetical protein
VQFVAFLFFNILNFYSMKKQLIYLTLLSLMACKKPPCSAIEVEPVAVKPDVPKKTPLVDCAKPTQSIDTAKMLIVGKWRLERTIFRNKVLRKTVYLTYKDFPKEVLHYREDGIVDVYIEDTLRASSPYLIQTLDKVSNYPADINRSILTMSDSLLIKFVMIAYFYLLTLLLLMVFLIKYLLNNNFFLTLKLIKMKSVIRSYSQLFAVIRSYSQLFAVIRSYSQLFAVIRSYSFDSFYAKIASPKDLWQ